MATLVLLSGCDFFSTQQSPTTTNQSIAPIVTQNLSNSTNSTNTTVAPPPIIIPPLHPGNLTIYYLNVGQGDAAFVIGPSNETMLIDCGPVSAGGTIVEFIRNLGLASIDKLVLTHMEADDMNGCPVEIFKLKPKKIYDNGHILADENYTKYQSTWSGNQSVHQAIAQNMPFDFDVVSSNFYVPYADGAGFSNNEDENSILVKLAYGYKSFLFTGDCNSDCEVRVLNSDLKSDVLKVAMGGLNNATSVLFLNSVSPSIAVISGTNPSPETLVKLTQKSITTYRTDISGTVVLTTDGRTIGMEKVT